MKIGLSLFKTTLEYHKLINKFNKIFTSFCWFWKLADDILISQKICSIEMFRHRTNVLYNFINKLYFFNPFYAKFEMHKNVRRYYHYYSPVQDKKLSSTYSGIHRQFTFDDVYTSFTEKKSVQFGPVYSSPVFSETKFKSFSVWN